MGSVILDKFHGIKDHDKLYDKIPISKSETVMVFFQTLILSLLMLHVTSPSYLYSKRSAFSVPELCLWRLFVGALVASLFAISLKRFKVSELIPTASVI